MSEFQEYPSRASTDGHYDPKNDKETQMQSNNRGKMQMWEYLTLEVEVGVRQMSIEKRSVKYIRYSKGGDHKIREEKFGTQMAVLGRTGWELVAVADRKSIAWGNRQVVSYEFKRPMSY